jgi:hypothetical protein
MTGHFEKFRITKTADSYNIVFPNKDTGKEIELTLPNTGIFESDPSRIITQNEVKNLAEQIADVLDNSLA